MSQLKGLISYWCNQKFFLIDISFIFYLLVLVLILFKSILLSTVVAGKEIAINILVK